MFSSTVRGLSGELSIAFEPVRCHPRSARRPRQPHRFALVAAHGHCQAVGGARLHSDVVLRTGGRLIIPKNRTSPHTYTSSNCRATTALS